MKKILKEFEEIDSVNNTIRAVNRIANIVKPDHVDKVIVKHAFTSDEGTIFVYITYISHMVKQLLNQNLISVLDDAMVQWVRILLKNVKDYLGVKIVVYNSEILDKE